jgi:hypothetical protein
MQLAPDTIREILLAIEDAPPNRSPNRYLPPIDQDVLFEHLDALEKGGFIEARFMVRREGFDGPVILQAVVTGITWEGREFAKNIRNANVWRDTLAHVAKKGGGVAVGALAEVAKQFAVQLVLPGN